MYSQTIDIHFCLKTSDEHLLFNETIETNKVYKYPIINIMFNKLSVKKNKKQKKLFRSRYMFSNVYYSPTTIFKIFLC